MPTCYLVVGQPRSGTSLLARMLHEAGIPFGERLLPGNPMNPGGFFVDAEFEELFGSQWNVRKGFPQAKTDVPAGIRGTVDDMIRVRNGLATWGIKHLFGSVLYRPLVESGATVRVIRTVRPKASSRSSLTQWVGHSPELIAKLVDWCDDAASEVESLIGSSNVLRVDFDSMVDRPEEQAARVAGFIGRGNAMKMAATVDPSLRRH